MSTFFSTFYKIIIALGNFLQPFFLLAIRLYWGWQFFEAGLGKFPKIDEIASYFGTLNIPFPLFNAYLAASTEMLGGLLLMVGFGARLAAIPLIITMLVALFTAHHDATLKIFEDSTLFLKQGPITFLLTAITIFVFGPGMFSLDGLLKGKNKALK